MPERNFLGLLIEPLYCGMRKHVEKKVASGRLTEDSDISKVFDSLEFVGLAMEAEEFGVEPAIEIKTVKDFLWLCRAIDFHRQRDKERGN